MKPFASRPHSNTLPLWIASHTASPFSPTVSTPLKSSAHSELRRRIIPSSSSVESYLSVISTYGSITFPAMTTWSQMLFPAGSCMVPASHSLAYKFSGSSPCTHAAEFFDTPSTDAGVCQNMLRVSSSSGQPPRLPWTAARFCEERARALGFSLDHSTRSTYHSHLQSYLAFCDLHNFSYEPTEETLCNFIIYMSHHIQPRSVPSYLFGICNQLEHIFPDVQSVRKRAIVTKTLQGCLRQFGTPPSCKLPLSVDHLAQFRRAYPSPSHDDLLFLPLVCCGFFALHRLGELVDADDPGHRSARERILRRCLDICC